MKTDILKTEEERSCLSVKYVYLKKVLIEQAMG